MTLPDSTNDPSGSVENDWSLLARYLANELSADERQTFERWIREDVHRLNELEELRRLWDQAGSLPSSSRLRAMWQSISHHMDGETKSTTDPSTIHDATLK